MVGHQARRYRFLFVNHNRKPQISEQAQTECSDHDLKEPTTRLSVDNNTRKTERRNMPSKDKKCDGNVEKNEKIKGPYISAAEAGYKSMREVLNNPKTDFPITIQATGRMRGVYTVHGQRTVTAFKCEVTGGGGWVYLAQDTDTSVVVTPLVDNVHYRTVEELRRRKRDERITHFVATTLAVCDNNSQGNNSERRRYYEEGQVFAFASSALSRSFKRERKRGVYVLVYPEMSREFLSLEVVGNFMKCAEPYNCSVKCLSLNIFPFYMSLAKQDKNLVAKFKHCNLLVTEKTRRKCFYASTKDSKTGDLKITAFTVQKHTSVKVLPKTDRVDELDVNEMKLAVDAFPLPTDERIDTFFEQKTYKEVGVLRLLDEIVFELRSVFNSKKTTKTQKYYENANPENFYESCGEEKLSAPPKIVPRGSLQDAQKSSVEKKQEKKRCSGEYANHKLRLQQEIKDDNKDLMVEFDKCGYVLIPLSRNHRLSIKVKEDVAYKSNENEGYGVTDNDDYHVYTYISMENVKKNVTEKNVTAPEKRQTVFNYDYTYFWKTVPNALMNAENTRRTAQDREVRRKDVLALSESAVDNLLCALLLKQHVGKFSQINGEKLVSISREDLSQKYGLSRFEALKLSLYVDGWRPSETTGGSWQTRPVCLWSVSDLSKYLVHVNMRALLRFAARHRVDVSLMCEMLSHDDVIDSMRKDHGVMFDARKMIELRKYITQDERPRFQLVR